MQHHRIIDENGRRLRRIAALLCALGDLAERAAGCSRATCFLVLWLLRPAETAARDYIDGLAPGAAYLAPPEPLGQSAGAAEALRLARIFRFLAATLAALAAVAESRLPSWRAAPANWLSGGTAALSRPAAQVAASAAPRLDSS